MKVTGTETGISCHYTQLFSFLKTRNQSEREVYTDRWIDRSMRGNID